MTFLIAYLAFGAGYMTNIMILASRDHNVAIVLLAWVICWFVWPLAFLEYWNEN
jgi:hypothetical protein